MKVVIGLGNPGSRYHKTRHNVGFEVIDQLAQSSGADRFQSRFQASVTEVFEDGEKLILVKPETFMNLSGRSVRQIVDFYNLELEDLIVVCDDINLQLGWLRARAKGTHGGHNGLRDIQNHLGTTEYSRLRVGVGGPRQDAVDHVLGRFSHGEQPVMDDAVIQSAQAIQTWWNHGIAECMNRFNTAKQKEKKEPKEKKPKEKGDGPSQPEESA